MRDIRIFYPDGTSEVISLSIKEELSFYASEFDFEFVA